MWAEIVKYLPTFRSAVLTGTDPQGYPLSVRCMPEPDGAARVLRITLPPGVELRPGPAGLLCHSHDERLWTLRSFNVRGTLERDAGGWTLRPHQFIPGGGISGPLATIRTLRTLRKTAARYLARRGMVAPTIPWARIEAAKAEAKAAGQG